MAVPVTRVRVLTDEVACMLENRRSSGMWTTAPERMGSFRFRIINNTKECHPPCLVVFEKPPPRRVPWTTLDPALLDENGMVQLCVSKGTAVPIHHIKGRKRVEFLARKPESPSSSATSSPAPSRASSTERKLVLEEFRSRQVRSHVSALGLRVVLSDNFFPSRCATCHR